MNQNKYPTSAQWNGVATHMQHTVGQYPTQENYHSAMPMGHSSGVQPMPPVYDEPQPMQADYASNYYTTSAQYASNSAPTNQHGYTLPPNGQMNYVQGQGHRPSHHIPRSPSTMPHAPYTHSPSHSYSYPHPSSSYSGNPLERPRSNSQVYPRALSPVNGYDQSPQPQYTEIPIPQTIGISSDYPTSSVRPFPCDLCALSFNRQHDLKRHRETHNGEKPYLCNGGCGKTFTRKDALKRHQLVKKCGKVDESYS